MRMLLRFLAVFTCFVLLVGLCHTGKNTVPDTRVVDVSWPNCRYQAPTGGFRSGVVGVTGGLDFRPNPCVTQESRWFIRYATYMNTGYPGVGGTAPVFRTSPFICTAIQRLCLAYNYGFHAATYAMQYAALKNVHTGMWWLDVETENSWTDDTQANRVSLMGMLAAISQYSFYARAGFYSTPHQWRVITGGWLNYLPAWVGTGALDETAARQACQRSAFTGGKTWLGQYTVTLDQNVPCASAFEDALYP